MDRRKLCIRDYFKLEEIVTEIVLAEAPPIFHVCELLIEIMLKIFIRSRKKKKKNNMNVPTPRILHASVISMSGPLFRTTKSEKHMTSFERSQYV